MAQLVMSTIQSSTDLKQCHTQTYLRGLRANLRGSHAPLRDVTRFTRKLARLTHIELKI